MATAADDTCTHTDYNRNTTLHLIDLPKETHHHHCAATPGRRRLPGGTHIFYDGATTDTATDAGACPPRPRLLASVVRRGARPGSRRPAPATTPTAGSPQTFDALDRQTTTAYSPGRPARRSPRWP